MELWDVTPHWVVAKESEAGLVNGYDYPTRLGADRWVAVIGAWHRMLAQGAPRPTIVAMVGTAVTVEAIDASGRHIDLEVDGGINVATAREAIAAGADVLVAGTATFEGGPAAYAGNIARLKGAAGAQAAR